MIASVSGVVLARGADWAVIEAAGLGYRVETTPDTAATCHVGESARLHTRLLVREDSHTLYGFAQIAQLEMFNLLLGVNGVGPRSALGVLATLTPEQIVQAVRAEDPKPFQAVSGIGPKSAKLIVVSLSGKLAAFAAAHLEETGAQSPAAAVDAELTHVTQQVVAALTGLGWQPQLAETAVADALAAGVTPDTQQLLRASLVLLQNR